MRILVLHSPYLSGPVSGENRVVEDELRLLREAGHEVTAYVPARTDRPVFEPAREGLAAIWSRQAVAEVRLRLRRDRPEVVHCHNLFPALSPAVLREASDAGAAVVVTLHNYRLLCLPATFLLRGEICERCLGHVPWRGVVHRCHRGSVPGSLALAASLSLHRALGTFERVSLYLAVSEFVRAKHIEAGLAGERIAIKPNFAWQSQLRKGPGEYFLFLGRLSPEKGLDALLRAWRKVDAPLVIAGEGPEAAALRRAAPPGVQFVGLVPPAEVGALLARARALLLPSICYEAAARSVVEAYAAGVPVVVSALGALPELVQPGMTGLLVPPRDPGAIAAAVERLLDDAESERQGSAAAALWRARYSPERGLEAIEAAYAHALTLAAA